MAREGIAGPELGNGTSRRFDHVILLVNPSSTAGAGAAQDCKNELEGLYGSALVTLETTGNCYDDTERLRDAVIQRDGIRAVCAVGGDGTQRCSALAILGLSDEDQRGTVLAPIHRGNKGDLAQAAHGQPRKYTPGTILQYAQVIRAFPIQTSVSGDPHTVTFAMSHVSAGLGGVAARHYNSPEYRRRTAGDSKLARLLHEAGVLYSLATADNHVYVCTKDWASDYVTDITVINGPSMMGFGKAPNGLTEQQLFVTETKAGLIPVFTAVGALALGIKTGWYLPQGKEMRIIPPPQGMEIHHDGESSFLPGGVSFDIRQAAVSIQVLSMKAASRGSASSVGTLDM